MMGRMPIMHIPGAQPVQPLPAQPQPVKPQSAQHNNHGSGGAGSYNFGSVAQPQPTQYNNHGSGGAGSYNNGMHTRRKRVAPMVMFENLVHGISGRNLLLKKN